MGVEIQYDAGPATDDQADGAQQAGAPTQGGSQASADLPGRRRILVYNGTATTIDRYKAVSWDLATAGFVLGKWAKITPTTDNAPYVGNAFEEILNGDWGLVEVGPGVGYAYITDAIAAETLLHVGAAQAGELETGVSGTDDIVAYTLEAEGATIEDVALCWFY